MLLDDPESQPIRQKDLGADGSISCRLHYRQDDPASLWIFRRDTEVARGLVLLRMPRALHVRVRSARRSCRLFDDDILVRVQGSRVTPPGAHRTGARKPERCCPAATQPSQRLDPQPHTWKPEAIHTTIARPPGPDDAPSRTRTRLFEASWACMRSEVVHRTGVLDAPFWAA